ncbi:MAG: DUF1080 domain-containing protein [Kiritimatiellae bacterium]|nr:DUF1080 domain-containing protein [Kiritimatiellia bacterium]
MKRLMGAMMMGMLLALPVLAEPDVEALVKRMPTKSHVDSDAICAEVLTGGAEALDSVFAKITPTTADDMAARFTAGALVHYSARPGADTERLAVAEALVRATDATTNDTIRAFMIEQLQWVGNAVHAAAIAPHLQNERLCSDALRTIRLTGDNKVEKILMKAVTSASPACQTLIVKALGDIASDAVVAPALALLKNDEAPAQAAALYAIARTGDPRQLTVMETAKATQPDLYLIYLARMLEQGHASEAARESEALLADTELLSAYRSKALDTLVAARGKKALATLSDVVITEDPALRHSAIRLLTALQGSRIDKAMLTRLEGAESKALAPWLLVLAGRGAAQVREPAVKALADPEAEVQLAAVDALGMLGGDASVAPLLATAGTNGAATKAAARALVSLKGEHVNTLLAKALASPTVATQVAALQALTSRGACEHMAALWPLLEQADSGLRKTALKSMERLASPADRARILAFQAKASDRGERSTAARTVLSITQDMAKGPERMAPILAAMAAGDDTIKQELIKILPALGGPAPLKIVVSTSNEDSSVAVRTAATRALTSWRDPAAVTPLLAVAANDKVETHRILALRGIARLLAMKQGSVDERVAHYEAALELATRDEERDALAGGLEKIGDASKWLRAKSLARGKPVTVSVGTEAGTAPARAVDGKLENTSAWYGNASPAWLQIDLGKAQKIGAARVVFYSDGTRFYTYQFETSVDGKKWTLAADQAGNRTPSTLEGQYLSFEPVEARYVRLQIIKNSGNPSVHVVEVEVYTTLPKEKTATPPCPAPPAPAVVTPAAVAAVKPAVKPAAATPAATEPVAADAEGFVPLFNRKDLTGWQGNTAGTPVKEGVITARQGNVFTKKEYANFIMKLEFKLTPGANNGLAIRWPGKGIPAHTGYELQVLDNTAAKYAKLKTWQYHGSIYSISPAKRGFLKPVGEWNQQTVIAKGDRITVILNGETIVDAVDVSAAKRPESGFIGFCGHGDEVHYRNLRIKELHNVPPRGFTALWNGKDLDGWWGLGTEHYKKYRDLAPEAFKARQAKSREDIRTHWRVEGDDLVNDGRGLYLSTDKFYGDFELVVDYKTVARADSGIYLRGVPQVQIWDSTKAGGKWNIGADKGSGGLWNNPGGAAGKDPLVLADKPFGEWNHFRIIMKGSQVSIWLNDQLVVDDAALSNYFDRKNPVPADGPIQLQTHGGQIRWRNVFIKELTQEEE